MMNRIEYKFKELRKRRKKAFIAFITAGDPDLKTTEKLVLAFEKAGVDIVELGVPFSDPLADGPVIQAASYRALQKGVTLRKIFKAVENVRRKSSIPIVLMTYYNPVFHFGEQKFVTAAKQAGVDGVIIPDLPPKEAHVLMAAARANNFATIFFLSPTTTKERMRQVIQLSTGFIYYVSLTGVTGTRNDLPKNLIQSVKKVKRLTQNPVCVGFGISKNSQVKNILKFADGVIVGSAIVDKIAKHSRKSNLIPVVTKFVRALKGR